MTRTFRRTSRIAFMLLSGLMIVGGCAHAPHSSETPSAPGGEWRAVHLFAPWHNEVPMFKRTISEKLAPLGINTIIIEVNYKLAFESHPELREPGDSLTKADAREIAALCRERHIRLIPLFNCLGHQSWAKTTFPLLVKYPKLDETPNVPKDNTGIYCRSWCPSNPETNRIAFALIDEIIDAFQPEAFHVGMDEVFLIGSDQCSRCKGRDTAELFARQVNDLHQHLVAEKKLTMLMWGDRFIDRKQIDYGGDYECSGNGTARAIDRVPKDIILCDWHYEMRDEYPSIRYFQEKGFRAMPCTWHNLKATRSFMRYTQQTRTENMLGYIFSTWVGAQEICPALLGEGDQKKLSAEARNAATTLEAGMKDLNSAAKE